MSSTQQTVAQNLRDAGDNIYSDEQYVMYAAADLLDNFDRAAAKVIAEIDNLGLAKGHPLTEALESLRAQRACFATGHSSLQTRGM